MKKPRPTEFVPFWVYTPKFRCVNRVVEIYNKEYFFDSRIDVYHNGWANFFPKYYMTRCDPKYYHKVGKLSEAKMPTYSKKNMIDNLFSERLGIIRK